MVTIEEWLRTYMANGTEPDELEHETSTERTMQQVHLAGLARNQATED